MYCKNCGQQIDDRAVFCPHCGVSTDNAPSFERQFAPQQPAANKWLVTVAKVFIILGFVALGIAALWVLILTIAVIAEMAYDASLGLGTNFGSLVIMLVYLIMIVGIGIVSIIFGAKALKSIKAKTKPTTVVCVCVLIFINIIAGILLLCTKDQDYL